MTAFFRNRNVHVQYDGALQDDSLVNNGASPNKPMEVPSTPLPLPTKSHQLLYIVEKPLPTEEDASYSPKLMKLILVKKILPLISPTIWVLLCCKSWALTRKSKCNWQRIFGVKWDQRRKIVRYDISKSDHKVKRSTSMLPSNVRSIFKHLEELEILIDELESPPICVCLTGT